MIERKWRGVLAPLDKVSQDGRMICSPSDGTPRTRELPLPVVLLGAEENCGIGRVDRVWTEDGFLHAEGSLTAEGERFPVGVDLDEVVSKNTAGLMTMEDWRLVGITVYRLNDSTRPSFPEAYIQVGQEAPDAQ